MTAKEIEEIIFCDGQESNAGYACDYTEEERIKLIEDYAKQYHEQKVALNLYSANNPYYEGKWYYFGKCKPYPVQVDGFPVRPYKEFDTKEECQSYIDSAC